MTLYMDAVKLLKQRRQGLVEQLGNIDKAVKALGGIRTNDVTTRRKPRFSAAARERIAAAQRLRWKRIKAAQRK